VAKVRVLLADDHVAMIAFGLRRQRLARRAPPRLLLVPGDTISSAAVQAESATRSAGP
jgi:hypothetical protein